MKSRTHSERGATAIIIAATMVLLIGMAAIAVDISDAKDERRSDQNSVDAATLGGAVEMIVSGDLQDVVDEVKALSDTNLGRTIPAADWTACVDPDALATPSDTIPGITGGSNCISFGNNDAGIAFARIRVLLPDQATDTSFGGVLGVTDLFTTADAVVTLEGSGASGAFPAAVFNGAGGGDDFCIKDGTGSAGSETCENNTTGDFGNFQPWFYTDVNPATTGPQNDTTCISGNQTAPLSYAMSEGIDHFLGIAPGIPGDRINGDDCPQFPGPAFPDRVDSGSGYSNADITDGLIKGGTWGGGYVGRLTKQIWPSPYGSMTIFGNAIDNRPLWSYIDSTVVAGPGVPQSCVDAATGPAANDGTAEAAFVQAQTDIRACLADANAPADLFTTDLYMSPRLTIVPEFHQSVPLGNNACCYDIKAFVPVFIDSIWTDNGAQWSCTGGVVNDPVGDFCRHDTGRTGSMNIPSAGNQRINSVSAIVLTCDVLGPPGGGAEKCKRVESGPNTVDVFVDLFLEE